MWHKRLLSADPEAGYREWFWSNPDTGEVSIEAEFDIKPIVEACKREHAATDERAPWKGDLHHVARVPNYVVDYEWRVNRRRILADKDYLRHWLNSPDNRAFRTRPGRV